MSQTIREALAEHHVHLSDEDYEQALESAEEGTLGLVELLIDEQVISKEVGCRVWSDRIGVAYVNPLSTIISDEAIASIPLDIARKGNIMPLYEIEGALTVAMPDPCNEAFVERLAVITKKAISPVFCLNREVRDSIELHYSSEKSVHELIRQLEGSQGAILAQMTPEELAGFSESKWIIRLCDAVLFLAIKERATDVHIEPREDAISIRFRIDGRLRSIFTIATALHAPLKSRIKTLCGLSQGEARFPQDGRFSLSMGTGTINFAVSIVPTSHGDRLVLHLLTVSGKQELTTLDQMLISQSILQPFKRILRSPNGMVFVTGPNGSGRSLTLYAALHEINCPEINICTIEDPIKMPMEGVIQTQVNEHIDLKFSTLLRSLLRQDPDVILVGEINDLETAKVATEAALTGHLVFSSLHTNNAIQAVLRLIEFGMEPYMVAPALLAVMAQRLTARICENCKVSYAPDPAVLERYFHDLDRVEAPLFYRGRGCPHCRDTGYHGQIAFSEMVVITDEMRSLISRGAGDQELVRAARKAGYKPLRYDALIKVLLGFTTIEELEAHAPFDWAGSER